MTPPPRSTPSPPPPRRPLRLCSVPGCPTLTAGGRCPTHANTRDRDRRHPIYNTRRWRRLRARILRDEPWCRHCGRPSQQADHIIALADGGAPWDPDNLQALCAACHTMKTMAEVKARRR